MANNLSVGAILAIVIVTALVVSVATISITGNVIKVKSAYSGTYVYTKAEIDNLLGSYYKKTEIDSKINGNLLLHSLMKEVFTKVDLSSDFPQQTAILNGVSYNVELMSASDSAATIKINGGTPQEIGEGNSKGFNGVYVFVSTADETNLKFSVTIVLFK